ncbi:hypothetical protein [Sporolactobacillus terrae]|uniref:hypothetical protein n=1 Tax=Sporolactobacillus terrae TaxID=269673 RepID=UPI0011180B30|nr:hypothetical protein [Sporolactobacillus terrae]
MDSMRVMDNKIIMLLHDKPFVVYQIFIMLEGLEESKEDNFTHAILFPISSNFQQEKKLFLEQFFERVELDYKMGLLTLENLKSSVVKSLKSLYTTKRLPKAFHFFYEWFFVKKTINELKRDVPSLDFFMNQVKNAYWIIEKEFQNLDKNEISTSIPISFPMTKEWDDFIHFIFDPYFAKVQVVEDYHPDGLITHLIDVSMPLGEKKQVQIEHLF